MKIWWDILTVNLFSLYFICAFSLYFSWPCVRMWQKIFVLYVLSKICAPLICASNDGVCSRSKLEQHCWYKDKWLSFLSAERNSWCHLRKCLKGVSKWLISDSQLTKIWFSTNADRDEHTIPVFSSLTLALSSLLTLFFLIFLIHRGQI